MKNFKYYLASQGFSQSTIQTYSSDVERLKKWLDQEHIDLEQVRHQDLLSYIQNKKNTAGQRSISLALNGLKHYYNYLEATGIILENPTTQIQIKGIQRKTLYHILSKDNLESLYHNYTILEDAPTIKNQNRLKITQLTQKRNKIILGLMVYQGLSSQELGRLTEQDLKLRAGRIHIPSSRRSNGRSLQLEAHQVLDMMDYTLSTRPALLALTQKESDKLFISSGKSDHFRSIIQKLLKKLKKAHPTITSIQQIRASVITHWLKIYNLRQVQYMAGHRYVSSTESYLINDLDDLQEAISQYHPMQ